MASVDATYPSAEILNVTTPSRIALDAPLQCRDIPVDGADCDLQLVGDRGGGRRPRSGAQDAADVEQAVGAA